MKYRGLTPPLECRKWVSTGDLGRIFTGSSMHGWRALADTGKLGEVRYHTERRYRHVNRDFVDAWVRQNGVPVDTMAYHLVKLKEWPEPRQVWTPGREQVARSRPAPEILPEDVELHLELISSPSGAPGDYMPRESKLPVSYDDTVQPRKLVAWPVVHQVVRTLVEHGSPSGEGDDLIHLRRVLSHWVLAQSEVAEPELWESELDERAG